MDIYSTLIGRILKALLQSLADLYMNLADSEGYFDGEPMKSIA